MSNFVADCQVLTAEIGRPTSPLHRPQRKTDVEYRVIERKEKFEVLPLKLQRSLHRRERRAKRNSLGIVVDPIPFRPQVQTTVSVTQQNPHFPKPACASFLRNRTHAAS